MTSKSLCFNRLGPCAAKALGALLALAYLALSAGTAQAATLRTVQGNVEIVRDGVTLPAVQGQRLKRGDVLQSAPAVEASSASGTATPGGEALVRFDDGARVALRSDSRFEMQELRQNGPESYRQITFNILKGSLRYISGLATLRKKVTFTTSTATIGIRGTDIEIVVSEEPVQDNNPGTYLKVNTGAATLTAADGAKVDVAPGEVAYGGEPELTMRGGGGVRRASARMVKAVGSGLFKASGIDALMK